MQATKIIGVVGIAAAFAGCAAAEHEPRTAVAAADCRGLTEVEGQVAELYAPGAIHRAEPTYRKEVVTRAYQPRRVSGAELYVPAERGMSEAYMERVLSCHAANRGTAAHPNDPLRVEGVDDVDVASAGSSLRIRITGVDHSAGEAIWERTRALTSPGTQVEVDQVAEAPSAGQVL